MSFQFRCLVLLWRNSRIFLSNYPFFSAQSLLIFCLCFTVDCQVFLLVCHFSPGWMPSACSPFPLIFCLTSVVMTASAPRSFAGCLAYAPGPCDRAAPIY
ncbi:hypothetical protein METBIDRAFT_196403 [Metschnikowia bicuspidata var. bicuspidata NRRL YB-4993]|uniref:Uncharacterized protein n=1 Tax=Metschnikowia bicuspidata var. bicuspidata NRRL YB-4993 TaxID=869754 RepID=A0A1A0H8I2_9ASCO|nr:hypothetical protein METBIDRAFT_196403 [Metschnikowia bicuspidata var. bicuspidata NRRL YB-4993]OBA20331.1 hypothetical protein METBIDRAFT_196403 [Metschnikowia bicuspidata var. bicuspidata NRRL YB-4993]